MKILLKICIFSIIALAVVAIDSIDPPPKSTPPTTIKTTTSTPTTASTSTTSAPKPTTTATTSTTSASTTSASTTSASTTSASTTSAPTSTVKPITTPAPSPTTTSSPSPTPMPVPDPTKGNWSVNYPGTNRSCIVMDVAVQLEILPAKGNTSIKINVPVNANSTGNCLKVDQAISLNWNVTKSQSNVLQFEFSKNVTVSELVAITFTMITGTNVSLFHRKAEFPTPLSNSYKCDKVQTLNLTDSKNVTGAYIHVSHLQFQAFRNATGHNFDSAKDCVSSVTSDVVPIVVGCVLAVLVVAVLVAYLVGRRRCQARGYLSMFHASEKEDHEEELIPMKKLSCFN